MPIKIRPQSLGRATDGWRPVLALIDELCSMPHILAQGFALLSLDWGQFPDSAVVLVPKASPLKNHLLAALPEVVQARLFPHLKLSRLTLGKVLYGPGHALGCAYFPTDSIVSLLYTMGNGASGEISVVGNDGMVGVSLFLGGQSTSSHAVVQSAGSAYRLAAVHLMDEFGRGTEMMMLLLRYAQALITQMTQTAACNRHHSIDEQMARWLLLSLDRLSGDKMAMTQQLIANMLSVSCARVTEVAGKLQTLGVIRYRNGRIEVIDRPMLEKLSCECYAVVRDETDRLFPGSATAVGHSLAPPGKKVSARATADRKLA